MLQREGLVQLEAQRGAVVFLPSVRDLREHYEIRAALESLAAAKAAEHFEATWTAPLEAILDEMRDGPPAERYIALNQRFHTTLYEHSARPQLVSMIAALRDASSAYLHIYRAQADFPVARLDSEHREILEACVARDPDARGARDPAPPREHRRTRGGAAVIRTTHVGSLPRPDDLIRTMFAKQEGVAVDPVALEQRTRSAVAEVVGKQREAGVDVMSDGEMGKPSYVTYITDRLDGFGGTSQPLTYADLVDFPVLRDKVFGDPGRKRRRTPACDAPISVRDNEAARTDIDHLLARAGTRRDRLHERRVAGRDRALLPQRLLRLPRGVPVRDRRRHAARVRGDHRRRAAAADRLPGPRDGPPHRVRGQEPGRVPRAGAAEHRGAQPRHAEHRARADADAPVLGQLRRPASPRRAARRHHRPRLRARPARDRVRGRQPAPRPRVGDLRGRRRCPRARS